MKQYQGEKAIISLTSWKARIKTVGLTIYSLLTQCPGFHIVLVLSEEEFPKKEAELPEDLVLMSRGGKIEILWVYRNYKSLKKILFTMEKYPDVPVISADDDCLYICNYASELYQAWADKRTNRVITYKKQAGKYATQGPCTLYAPGMCNIITAPNQIELAKYSLSDDSYYEFKMQSNNILSTYIHDTKFPFVFHNDNGHIHDYRNRLGFLYI